MTIAHNTCPTFRMQRIWIWCGCWSLQVVSDVRTDATSPVSSNIARKSSRMCLSYNDTQGYCVLCRYTRWGFRMLWRLLAHSRVYHDSPFLGCAIYHRIEKQSFLDFGARAEHRINSSSCRYTTWGSQTMETKTRRRAPPVVRYSIV